jgi:hypothetical protein
MFLWAALGSMGMSLALELMGEEKKVNFIGHWAPTLLIFGLYIKWRSCTGPRECKQFPVFPAWSVRFFEVNDHYPTSY